MLKNGNSERFTKGLVTLAVIFQLVLVGGFLFSSCSEDDTPLVSAEISDEEVTLILDEEVVNSAFDDLNLVAEDASVLIENVGGRLAQDSIDDDSRLRCAEFTFEVLDNLFVITVDFGDGCEGPGGRVRKGKIRVSFTGRRRKPGSVQTITLENYQVDDFILEGTKTITNLTGSSNETIFSFNELLVGGKVIWPDGSFATREFNRTRSWFLGDTFLDDEFWVEGVVEGLNRSQRQYRSEITQRITWKRRCFLQGVFIPVSGTKIISQNGQDDLIIDFGEGECDNIITVKKGDRTKDIEVNPRRVSG